MSHVNPLIGCVGLEAIISDQYLFWLVTWDQSQDLIGWYLTPAQLCHSRQLTGFCLGADCLTRSPDFNSTHGFLLSDSTWNRSNNFNFMSLVKIYFVKIYGGRWNFVCCINVFMNDTVVNFYLSPKQAMCFLFVWNISRERSFASNTLVSSLPLIISFQE